jgi:DNA-binding NtrC family response regulator
VDRRVLVIDDDPSMLELLQAELEQRHFQVVAHTSPEAALGALAEHDFDVVLSDISMRAVSGVDLWREVVTLREDTPVIVMAVLASVESAVASIRAGAYDFVTKPFDTSDLALTIERALKHRELREEVKRLRLAVSEQRRLDEMVGESLPMRKIYELIARVAPTEAAVLVTGESGTGKELVARTLHTRSPRSSGPFVAINCAAMSESLLESDIFGHTKGAFTDARSAREGLFARAGGGTLFLDEVGEMPAGMQAKLLRALQERRVRPVGGDAEVPFDIRLITATSRDLELDVHQGRFREDLFYRVNVVQVNVPPLRTRENDVLLLAQEFLKRAHSAGSTVVGMKGVTAERLIAYPWPGNVRELRNCIERAVAVAQSDRIGVDDLPERIANFKSTRITLGTSDPSSILPMNEVERRYVARVLETLGGNKAWAARALGMDRRTLYRKLEGWSKAAGSPSGLAEHGSERLQGIAY